MAKPYSASMTGGMDLAGGYKIRLVATSPTDGSTIAAITVSSLVMLLEATGDTTPSDLETGDWQLVPGSGA